MLSKSTLLVASAFVGAALVNAQAAPNWIYIPGKCQDQCAQTIESAYLCQNQYSGNTNSIYGCFCNRYPTDADDCASCLTSNNAGALASLLTSTKEACPQAIQSCFFSCSFDTCAQGDIACQCSESYLENIYNCGSCNTANGNSQATQLSDWQTLQQSCKAQSYSGADGDFSTIALPSPTVDGYVAPTLTAEGGGAAATGDATATDGVLAAGGSGSGSSSGSGSGSGSGAAAGAASAGTSGKSAGSKGSASKAVVTQTSVVAAATPSGGASMNSVPAIGSLLVVAGAMVIFF